MFKKLGKDNRGQAVSEYGLLVALIAVALVTGIVAFREELVKVFEKATGSLSTSIK